MISEGVAVVVLKRLADAERDGDRIYAVIKGLGASSDGRAKGLTAPSPEGQVRAVEASLRQVGGRPSSTVGYVEAHGTGHGGRGRGRGQRDLPGRSARPVPCGGVGRDRLGQVDDRPHQVRGGPGRA